MNKYYIISAFMYIVLIKEVQSAVPISWLPCRFTDENITLTSKGENMTPIYRPAVLQFGRKEDPPVNLGTVTFLITPSKLNMRRSLGGAEVGELTCDLSRYSTDGSHVRWPVRGEHEYNRWFTLRINHSKNLFNILAFIRQSTDQPPTGQHDYKSWPVIKDTDVLTTSVVMMLQTQTPEVKSRLKSKPKLHCQFNIDHKAPNITVRWHKIGSGTSLFGYRSQSRLTQGSGVSLTQLPAGDATYTVPVTKVDSEGRYVCSVSVYPLQGSVTVKLKIEEPPHVSLDVDETLTLSEGEEKRVVCWADGYYPLDMNMSWSHQGITDVGPRLEPARFSSHSTNRDGTYRLLGFIYIQTNHMDSGRKFTCSVSHTALRAPIRKTFTLIVTEPALTILIFDFFLMLVVVVLTLLFCHRGKKYRVFQSLYLHLCRGRKEII